MSSARVPPSDSDLGGQPPPARRPVSKPPRRGSRNAQEQLWEELAGPLSSAAMRLRSVRSQHAGGTHVSRELDAIIREVDTAFATVMRTPGPPPSGDEADPPRRTSPSASALRAVRDVAAGSAASVGEACEVFDRWVQDGCGQRLLSGATSVEADALLGRVSEEVRLLPAPTTVALGLDSRCSYARASSLLVWARHAPDGPRCRSYRAARYFLTDADPDVLPAPPERNS
jgi:hypothetical protein